MTALSASAFGPYLSAGASAPYEDLQGDVSQGAANSTLTHEAFRDTPYRMYFFRHDQADTLNFRFQLPHTWDPDTSVSLHLHLVPMVDPAADQVVRFTGQYVWADATSAVPANAGWTTFTVDATISPGDAFKQKFVRMFLAAPAANSYESDVLLVHLYRAGLDAADTYTTAKVGGTAAANLGLLSADCHYQRVKLGTATPAPEGM